MKNGNSRYRLSPDKLRWNCEPSKLPLASSTTQPSLQIIGQERALDALRMGLDINLPGYHIFVGSKAPWHTIDDQLEQHEEFPEED